MITRFKIFEKYGDVITLDIFSLEILVNGDLKISLTEKGKEEVEEINNNDDKAITQDNFVDWFEEVENETDYYYVSNLKYLKSDMINFDAPGIIYNFHQDDDYNYVLYDDTEIYFYPNYRFDNFVEELMDNGYVVFETIKPFTPEQIEINKMHKNTKKYNL